MSGSKIILTFQLCQIISNIQMYKRKSPLNFFLKNSIVLTVHLVSIIYLFNIWTEYKVKLIAIIKFKKIHYFLFKSTHLYFGKLRWISLLYIANLVTIIFFEMYFPLFLYMFLMVEDSHSKLPFCLSIL